MQRISAKLLTIGLLTLWGSLVGAADDRRHLGVATCDSSNCHGSAVRQLP